MRLHLEEQGRALSTDLIVDTFWDIEPAEEMVRYYPDGSGYPGSPGSIDLCETHVWEFRTNTHTITRDERPDWFELLDKIAFRMIEGEERYEEQATEHLGQ